MAFQLGVPEVGEAGGGQCGVVEACVRREGGGQFPDDVAEGGAVESERGAGACEEVEGVGVGVWGLRSCDFRRVLCGRRFFWDSRFFRIRVSSGIPVSSESPVGLVGLVLLVVPVRVSDDGSTCQLSYAPRRARKARMPPASRRSKYGRPPSTRPAATGASPPPGSEAPTASCPSCPRMEGRPSPRLRGGSHQAPVPGSPRARIPRSSWRAGGAPLVPIAQDSARAGSRAMTALRESGRRTGSARGLLDWEPDRGERCTESDGATTDRAGPGPGP